MLKHFTKVFVSSRIGLRKPDAEAFAHVAQEIGVAPERILFFDDSAANIAGARAVGFQTVLGRSNADIVAALEPLIGKP